MEKATILHAEHHRPADKAPVAGMSRHYFDLYQLSRQEIGRQALDRADLLARVVAHKRLFFASAWAHYERPCLAASNSCLGKIMCLDFARTTFACA